MFNLQNLLIALVAVLVFFPDLLSGLLPAAGA